MKKEESETVSRIISPKESVVRSIMSIAFWVGIIIVVIIYMNKPSNTNIEDISYSVTIEDLQEQIERLEEKLGDKENQYEELEKEYEEAKDLIELLCTQLEELNVEPYEL